MSDVDVAQWLEQWVELNLDAHRLVAKKAQMHDRAKACAEEAVAVGVSIAELKEAADGDLEAYFVRRQNAMAGRTGSADTVSDVRRMPSTALGRDDVVAVHQERLDVDRREASRGAVTVRSRVVEIPVGEPVILRAEGVRVDRRLVDLPLTATDGPFQDRAIELDEYAEEVVVAKEARIVEEISLRRQVHERIESVHDTLRHMEVAIEDDRTARVGDGLMSVTEVTETTSPLDLSLSGRF